MSNANDSENRQCEACGIDITDKKQTARTCSPRCRKALHDKTSVTENVTLSEPVVTLKFRFYTTTVANGTGRKEDEKSQVREAKYWYDVPLGATPILEKGWPTVPEYMNGRQYFLWWKNDFKLNDKKGPQHGEPVIHNPFE